MAYFIHSEAALTGSGGAGEVCVCVWGVRGSQSPHTRHVRSLPCCSAHAGLHAYAFHAVWENDRRTCLEPEITFLDISAFLLSFYFTDAGKKKPLTSVRSIEGRTVAAVSNLEVFPMFTYASRNLQND